MTLMDNKIKNNESLKEYQVRLCKNKDLYNLSWDDIADLLNSETDSNFSQDKYRKWYYAFSDGYDYAVEEGINEEEIIKEIEEKTLRFEKEKIKYQDQRREAKKLIRDDARIENLRDEMLKAIDELAKEKPLEWYERSVYPNADRESALILSDLHFSLFTSNYWNEFNIEEFYRRLNRLNNLTIKYSKEQKVKTINLFVIGDLVNGLIHTLTRISNTEDTVRQTQHVAEALAETIVLFANEFEFVNIYMTRGNHDRITPNKKESLATESFSDLIAWYLKARLSHIENINFAENEYDDEIIVADILGNKIFAVHGDRDKVDNVVQNLSLMLKQFPDYVFMAHYHHHFENEVHGVEIVVNSSFSGVDEYAKQIRKTSKPSQKLIIFDKYEGRLLTYNIRLDLH